MKEFLIAILACALAPAILPAQRSPIGNIDNQKRHILAGHLQSQLANATDLGPAADTLEIVGSMLLQASPVQTAGISGFLERLQDPASPDFHAWLTPEEFADRYGANEEEIQTIADWLRSQGLTVVSTARARNRITFRGPVRSVENAFQTRIRRFGVDGEIHFANAREPSVPDVFAALVLAVTGLHDFRLKPRVAHNTSVTSGRNFLAPDDIATIYNLKPLYAAGTNGTGQKLAVVGQTQINLSDIQQFRSAYGLPANDPQITLVPNLPNPGTVAGDLLEADLDLEWSGAVARNATILYVYSQNVEDALQYVVDNNLAPVVSMSYGLCEQQTGSRGLAALRATAQQAVAQGITWLASSGDSGAADCFSSRGRNTSPLAVDAPASVPEVTGVGGAEFNEGTGTYWNRTNDANQASAISYIPETVWNDSSLTSPAAGGGGASILFPKPSWQAGPGVPADSARDVPDISLTASASHDGYLFFSGGQQGAVGGTSASAPVFAGMVALLNQFQVANGLQAKPGLGNINPQLYLLAQSAPSAFHDITSGNNKVTQCEPKATACTPGSIGYDAGPGYDLATGLGSVDAFNLITAWGKSPLGAKSTATLVSSVRDTTIAFTASTVLTATVNGAGGITPTGTVTFLLGTVPLGSAPLSGTGGKATATLTVQGTQLTPGTVSIAVQYNGDSAYNPAVTSVLLVVTPPLVLTVTASTNAASFRQVYAPGMIMSVFGALLANSTQSPAVLPLPTQFAGVAATVNGVAAPLYYISPSQINLQIPYATAAGTASLRITFNAQTSVTNITIAFNSPGIFTNPANGAPVPDQTAKRGQTVTLYITGEGAVTPQPATGSLPLPGTTPVPTQQVKVSVGGVTAPTTYVGVPSWSIGATQINYTVPLTAPLGAQPVIVTVGTAASAPATITVTP